MKRLEKLESLATGHKGVQKAYAIQAGREIRVIVKQEDFTDAEWFQLSRDLAKKIEQELTYPGQIKVTVIRESRFVDFAKMKVLCIGDIMGEPGRRAVARAVPRLIAKHNIDAGVANGENVAGGFGITPDLMDDLFDLGVSVITTGNHAWDKKEEIDYFRVNLACCVRPIIPLAFLEAGVLSLRRQVASGWGFFT